MIIRDLFQVLRQQYKQRLKQSGNPNTVCQCYKYKLVVYLLLNRDDLHDDALHGSQTKMLVVTFACLKPMNENTSQSWQIPKKLFLLDCSSRNEKFIYQFQQIESFLSSEYHLQHISVVWLACIHSKDDAKYKYTRL